MRFARPILLSIVLFNIAFKVAYGQARNSIGVGAGLNFPFKTGYSIGRDRVLQMQLFSKKQWAFMPVLGLEKFKGKQEANMDVAFLNMAAKYYVSKTVFIYAGPSVYAGGNDNGVAGAGGAVGAGYDWTLDGFSSIEFSLRTDFLQAYTRLPPAAGIRVAYKFNFKHKDGERNRFDIP
ncbi:hypothetical protein ABDD95_01245 [Mucilaginibacter sp. PAMB04274]|uniref:hypothetical protein n=1 Tax=Mucilaginibacter sp. PAMB04274 TaxID=3138568 RepID=UPI0031F6A85A